MLPIGSIAAGVAIGFLGGLLSGMFGIGGGIVTTPLIRLLLSVSALGSVATTLPAIIPSAVTGSAHYLRARVADWRIGLTVGIAGAFTSALGALAVTQVGGTVAMVLTAAMILYAAADTIHSLGQDAKAASAISGSEDDAGESQASGLGIAALQPAPTRATYIKSAATGIAAGFYSGFLGLGGGFLIVPLLRRWVGLTHKQAVGTSLLAVAILSVPGTAMHAYLGNIEWGIALALALGVVPGAALGARIMIRTSERAAKIAFAVLMVVLGTWLVISEVAAMPQ